MSFKTQRNFKFFSLYLLPWFSCIYFGAFLMVGLENASSVLGILAVMTLLINCLLYLFGDKDYAGQIVATTKHDGTLLYSLELDSDLETLKDKDDVTFKVQNITLSDVSQDLHVL